MTTQSPADKPAASTWVRPYVMTGGRTAPRRDDLRWETAVAATGSRPRALPSEQASLLCEASRPVSIAELSGRLKLPTAVVAVIAEDLVAAEALRIHHTDPVEIQLSQLTKMIERVRAL